MNGIFIILNNLFCWLIERELIFGYLICNLSTYSVLALYLIDFLFHFIPLVLVHNQSSNNDNVIFFLIFITHFFLSY